MELRKAVDGAVEQLRGRMFEPIPERIFGGVAEPEVRPEVDDRGPAGRELRDERGGRSVGKREKDRIDRRERRVHVEAGDRRGRRPDGDSAAG